MKRSWIHHVRGQTVRQARVGLGDLHEELFGRQGFVGPVAMLYHPRHPGNILRIEGDLVPRSVAAAEFSGLDQLDARGEPNPVLSNDDVVIAISQRSQPMPYCYRNVLADLLYFVHRGTGVMATEFGPLRYEPGDYILLPKGVTFRHMPDAGESLFFVIESRLPIDLSEHDQVGRHAPFDLTLLTAPEIEEYDWSPQPEWELRIKHQGGHTSVFYEDCPLDVVGWKGDLFPFKLNVRDIMPLSSERIHLAPSSWATFENQAFMVMTFLPQQTVADQNAEELSSNHRNIDCDEAFLFHEGFGKHGTGSLLHMPQGFVHGPSQQERDMFKALRTPEMRRPVTAVSIDTYKPLTPSDEFHRLTANVAG